MTSALRTAFLIAGTCSGSWIPAQAQSLQKLSVQGSGAVLFGVTRDPNYVSRTRLGYEGQLRYTISRLSVGAGYQRSTVFAFPQNPLRLDLSLGFFEPRYVFATRGRAGLYVAGRVGLGKLVCADGCASNKTDAAFGGGGGVLFLVNRRLSADLGGQYFRVSGGLSQGFIMARSGVGVGL